MTYKYCKFYVNLYTGVLNIRSSSKMGLWYRERLETGPLGQWVLEHWAHQTLGPSDTSPSNIVPWLHSDAGHFGHQIFRTDSEGFYDVGFSPFRHQVFEHQESFGHRVLSTLYSFGLRIMGPSEIGFSCIVFFLNSYKVPPYTKILEPIGSFRSVSGSYQIQWQLTLSTQFKF